jgi:hypothetical protein
LSKIKVFAIEPMFYFGSSKNIVLLCPGKSYTISSC